MRSPVREWVYLSAAVVAGVAVGLLIVVFIGWAFDVAVEVV